MGSIVKSQKGLAAIVLTLLLSGCPNPTMLRPVADQNATNILHYNQNVDAIIITLQREATFHGQLSVQIARNQLAQQLIQLPQKWLGPPVKPTGQDLSNPNSEPHLSMKKDLDAARAYKAEVSELYDSSDTAQIAMAGKYPLVVDIAMETPGFKITRVLEDAFDLKALNSQILSEKDPDLRNVLVMKRNRMLDQYLPVQIQTGLMKTYLQALEDYLAIVREQGQIAAMHAGSIAAFANTEPQFSTLSGALRDQELRSGVLDLVEASKGKDYAQRVEGYLSKADDFFAVVAGLSK